MEGPNFNEPKTVELGAASVRAENLQKTQETLKPVYEERLSEKNVLERMEKNGYSFLPEAERI